MIITIQKVSSRETHSQHYYLFWQSLNYILKMQRLQIYKVKENDKSPHVCIHPSLPHKQEVAQGSFLCRIEQIRIQSFSFSNIGCHTKAKEHSLPYYFTHSWKEESGMWMEKSCLGCKLGSLCSFPATLSIKHPASL